MNIDYLITEKWSGQNRTCRTGSTTESESANQNIRMYRHDGPRPHPSPYTKYYYTFSCSISSTVIGTHQALRLWYSYLYAHVYMFVNMYTTTNLTVHYKGNTQIQCPALRQYNFHLFTLGPFLSGTIHR